ncbi:MAG: NADH-quinone oxidoreductase subunit L, partial [Acidobacteriota bacterium]
GWWLAHQFYLKHPEWPERLTERFRALYLTLLNKYWVDELYDAIVVKPTKLVSTYLLWKFVDVVIIDGLVNGTGLFIRSIGGGLRRFQSGYARSYGAWILLGGVIVLSYFSLI